MSPLESNMFPEYCCDHRGADTSKVIVMSIEVIVLIIIID